MAPLSRREFLKLAGLGAGATAALGAGLNLAGNRPAPLAADAAQLSPRPNILLIVFDSLSARHLALYGYPRQTSTNIEHFAQRATVYHNHHSAGNFTTPSTASLFTGLYPWSHRAINLGGLALPKWLPNSLFPALVRPESSYRLAAYTQNILADLLIYQSGAPIRHIDLDSYTLAGNALYPYSRDEIHALYALDQFMIKRDARGREGRGSLFLSVLRDLGIEYDRQKKDLLAGGKYPEGLPRITSTDLYFDLAQVMDGVMGLLDEMAAPGAENAPFFAYIHLMPPHEPYKPARPFFDRFADGWQSPVLPEHRLGSNIPQAELDAKRQRYDELVANVDVEFGRLINHLEQTGILDSSYVILTSDHGEMFERGEQGHATPLLYEPIVHVPLLISSPGQHQRQDIYDLTSTVDLLPTILNVGRMEGSNLPTHLEGVVLPGLGIETPGEARRVYVVEGKKNAARQSLLADNSALSTAVLEGAYKLIHYKGYDRARNRFELYDLQADPLEQNNLLAGGASHPVAGELKADLEERIRTAEGALYR